jgi:catechol 2,3-dioxygenase-like lactoylglutathione lyase family enzyme
MNAKIQAIVPVLRVADVSRSIAWYRDVLGFDADPFPTQPPHVFAILFKNDQDLMLRQAVGHERHPAATGWDVYIRLTGGQLTELYVQVRQRTAITRRLEKMPYGMTEFELQDPDGWRLCFGEELS